MSRAAKALFIVWCLIALFIGALTSIGVVVAIHPEETLKALTAGFITTGTFVLLPPLAKRVYNFYNAEQLGEYDAQNIAASASAGVLGFAVFIFMLEYNILVALMAGCFFNASGLMVSLHNYRNAYLPL